MIAEGHRPTHCPSRFSSLVVLDVHVLLLLLAQAVFDEVLSLARLAGDHGLPHGVGAGGAVVPRWGPFQTLKSVGIGESHNAFSASLQS